MENLSVLFSFCFELLGPSQFYFSMPVTEVWACSALGVMPCQLPHFTLPSQVLHPGMGTVQLFSYKSLHLSLGWDCSYLNRVYF